MNLYFEICYQYQRDGGWIESTTVRYKLCPGDCYVAGIEGCTLYHTDLRTYLDRVTRHGESWHTAYCNLCAQVCPEQSQPCTAAFCPTQVSEALDCNRCTEHCVSRRDREELGFIDAMEFLEYQLIYYPEDDDDPRYYAGPVCSGGGFEIGVFLDEDCSRFEPLLKVDDFVQDENGQPMQLWYGLLVRFYSTCLSCSPADGDLSMVNQDDDSCGDLWIVPSLFPWVPISTQTRVPVSAASVTPAPFVETMGQGLNGLSSHTPNSCVPSVTTIAMTAGFTMMILFQVAH